MAVGCYDFRGISKLLVYGSCLKQTNKQTKSFTPVPSLAALIRELGLSAPWGSLQAAFSSEEYVHVL